MSSNESNKKWIEILNSRDMLKYQIGKENFELKLLPALKYLTEASDFIDKNNNKSSNSFNSSNNKTKKSFFSNLISLKEKNYLEKTFFSYLPKEILDLLIFGDSTNNSYSKCCSKKIVFLSNTMHISFLGIFKIPSEIESSASEIIFYKKLYERENNNDHDDTNKSGAVLLSSRNLEISWKPKKDSFLCQFLIRKEIPNMEEAFSIRELMLYFTSSDWWKKTFVATATGKIGIVEQFSFYNHLQGMPLDKGVHVKLIQSVIREGDFMKRKKNDITTTTNGFYNHHSNDSNKQHNTSARSHIEFKIAKQKLEKMLDRDKNSFVSSCSDDSSEHCNPWDSSEMKKFKKQNLKCCNNDASVDFSLFNPSMVESLFVLESEKTTFALVLEEKNCFWIVQIENIDNNYSKNWIKNVDVGGQQENVSFNKKQKTEI